MGEQAIKCFQHCTREKNILCFTIPLVCPLCSQDTVTTAMRIPPFIIDSPFVSAYSTQCCVVIKPTRGSFLEDFTNQSNLHVGVTNSRGVVYEFDERGITVGAKDWNQCIRIRVILNDSADEVMYGTWDEQLSDFVMNQCWTRTCYNEVTHNCYDFVLYFLRTQELKDVNECLSDRSSFCVSFILPKTQKAGKYISIYREIVAKCYVLQDP